MTMNDEIVYVNKKGKRHKKPPKGVPPFRPKPPVNGEGVSRGNGIPVKPKLDMGVRKRAKRKKV